MDNRVKLQVQPTVSTKHPGLNQGSNASPRDKSANNGSAKPASRIPTIDKIDAAAFSTGMGGGALRSIDQKFEVNPCNGTLALTLPLPVTAGRDDCHPLLNLSYNSGGGNGPFGIGWNLSLGSITRKTTQEIPHYDDSDVFLLSNLDDLVEDGVAFAYSGSLGQYLVQRYRSRVETGGAVMRIEKFTHQVDKHDVFWRTISPTNVTSFYGRESQSRIMDAAGHSGPQRIFSWLLSEVYDPNGNAMLFEYKEENDEGIRGADDSLPIHEVCRDSAARRRARYPKSIKYGNVDVARDLDSWQITPLSANDKWMFEVIFDYGDHDVDIPEAEPTRPWLVRPDAFSRYSSGFEIRSYRLCQRILLFHHFEDKLPRKDYLVSSYSLQYDESPTGSLLRSFIATGHVWNQEKATYDQQSLAPYTFSFSKTAPVDSLRLQTMKPDCLQGLEVSNARFHTRWVDLNGEGAPGLLVQRDGAWYYQRNENALDIGCQSDGSGDTVSSDDGSGDTMSREDGDGGEEVDWPKPERDFGPVQIVSSFPASGDYTASFLEDLDGNGLQDLVLCDQKGRATGYFECNSMDDWQNLKEFPTCLSFNVNDDSMHRLDLTGNGRRDVLCHAKDGLIWFPSLGKDGYDLERHCEGMEGLDMFVTSHKRSAVFFTDMTGDGLTDIVKIANGRVSYCPNLGHGRFGSELCMGNPPLFDSDDQFSFQRLHLLDLDGSGTTDLVYLTADGGVAMYFNQCGNGWSDKLFLEAFVKADNLSSVFSIDLLGNGTSCLCWVGPDSAATDELVINYLDLAGGSKPHLLKSWSTGTGLTTSVRYAPSMRSYLQDEKRGRPWKTKLPFPVHTVSRLVERDEIVSSTRTTRFRYHDGYYDGLEREFRGFGAVEKWETENFTVTRGKKILETPTTYTKMWYHTGAVHMGLAPTGSDLWSKARLASVVMPGLKSDQWPEAYRALKGMLLRSEVYGLDRSAAAAVPYTVSETSFDVSLVSVGREATGQTGARVVCQVRPRESLTEQLERLRDDSRLEHQLILETNTYGDVAKSLLVRYGRKQSSLASPESRNAQQRTHITYTEKTFTNAIDYKAIDDKISIDNYYKPAPSSTTVFHFDDLPFPTPLLDIEAIRRRGVAILGGTKYVGDMTRTYYRSADLTHCLDHHSLEAFSRVDREYVFAMDNEMIESISGQKDVRFRQVSPRDLLYKSGGYVELERDTCAWAPTAEALWEVASGPGKNTKNNAAETLRAARAAFFVPRWSRDAFGHVSEVVMDEFHRLPVETIDPAGNRTRATYDYRVMKPAVLTDPNGNRVSVVYDCLGEPAAVAQMGKSGESVGDSIEGIPCVLSEDELLSFMEKPSRAVALRLVGRAGSRRLSSSRRLRLSGSSPVELPLFRLNLARTTHAMTGQSRRAEANAGDVTAEIIYYDGRGMASQQFNLTQWAGNGGTEHEWRVSKNTVNNSAGNSVVASKPFFSSGNQWKPLPELDEPLTFTYRDAMQRNVGTLYPDHTWTKQCFTPWSRSSYDTGDTCLVTDPRTDPDIGFHFERMYTGLFMPSWYELRIQSGDNHLRQSAHKSGLYAAKPHFAHLDSRGNTILTVETGDGYERAMRVEYDVFGCKTAQYDAMDRLVEAYDLHQGSRPLIRRNMESGAQITVVTSTGQPLLSCDSAGRQTRYVHDSSGRKTHTWVLPDREAAQEVLWSRYVYGETVADPERNNLRGQVFEIHDQSGIRRNTVFDFKGNCLSFDHRLANEYQTILDWRNDVPVEAQPYTTKNSFDALNRNIAMCNAAGRVTIRTFDLVGNLQSLCSFVAAMEDGAKSTGIPSPLKGAASYHIRNATYAADGQPLRVDYGNTSHSSYTYDELTGQVVRRRTWRDDGRVLEDLTMVYDCMGRVSSSQDRAQQTLFFRNGMVEPVREYHYDAFGRLSRATGRETVDTGADTVRSLRQVSASSPLVRQALGSGQSSDFSEYVEYYVYDDADNLRLLRHEVSDKSVPGWTRFYTYKEPSLLEPSRYSNRLSQTCIGRLTERYGYGGGAAGQVGCMTSMTGFSRLQWDHRNKLQCTARQKVNSGLPETTWYVYDDSGKRVRKVTARSSEAAAVESGTKARKRKETIFLDSVEIYRVYHGDGVRVKTTTTTSLVGASADPEAPSVVTIEDFQVAADSSETESDGGSDSDDRRDEQAPRSNSNEPLLYRYVVSPNLETDDKGQIVSYEEYTPFGVSVLLMCKAKTEAPRRYRFALYHRDHETGLYACGARYYAPWLGRWTSPDPLGMVDGPNVYAYVLNEPVNLFDPSGTMFCCKSKSNKPAPQFTKQAATAQPKVDGGHHPALSLQPGIVSDHKSSLNIEEDLNSKGHALLYQKRHQDQQDSRPALQKATDYLGSHKKEILIKGGAAIAKMPFQAIPGVNTVIGAASGHFVDKAAQKRQDAENRDHFAKVHDKAEKIGHDKAMNKVQKLAAEAKNFEDLKAKINEAAEVKKVERDPGQPQDQEQEVLPTITEESSQENMFAEARLLELAAEATENVQSDVADRNAELTMNSTNYQKASATHDFG
ncbi:uncharacterized protein E0L32_004997 [Thyridium curvatum]|uniref:SpvB-domain-containing protein n=1 Tax=Thyridium curvatum TaxID=1093900 RepID=A0A507BDN8_9PEZI|nr:uncharacterized protein E0L32_004997 [Thyridium curvatum]TPX14888.1 hypothetical protein E0L32_004997 [Thyridium curvatum]